MLHCMYDKSVTYMLSTIFSRENDGILFRSRKMMKQRVDLSK